MSSSKKKTVKKSPAKKPPIKKSAKTTKPAGKTVVRRPPVKSKIYSERHISIFLMVICFLQTCFLGSLLGVLIFLNIPDIRTVAHYTPDQATVIYDRHGTIVDRIFIENRTVIPLESMSSFLPDAFVSAEDGRFFEHPGLDLISVLRAFINNIRSGAKSQGGSTITQQVAKSLLLTPEKSYIRKFKEAVLAWRIDKLLTKNEILYIYLNQIYLGEGAHGVEAASRIYFGKSAAQLTLGECALLAGLPQAPSRYSLFDHLDRAVVRQKYVLNRMASDGKISAPAANLAYSEKIQLKRKNQTAGDVNGFYLQAVKKEARAILKTKLQTAGVRIYTHLDTRLNREAMRALQAGTVSSMKRQARYTKKKMVPPQGALVCIETAGGQVRALLGGTSFNKSPFDRALQARRPAGSTFKPFVFAAALEKGWKADSLILDAPLTITGKVGSSWSPKNYSGKYYGKTTLTYALANSLNTASVRLMQEIGYKKVHEIAKHAGMTVQFPPDLSLSLGAVDVSLFEMTGAYTAFAGDGSYIKPTFIKKIVSSDGSVLYQQKAQDRVKVIHKNTLKQMRMMLSEVVTSGTAKSVSDVPQVRGGKTGTSDDNRDAWFVGFDKKNTVGVWVGNDKNQSLGKTESGGTAAAPIWRSFMLKLYR